MWRAVRHGISVYAAHVQPRTFFVMVRVLCDGPLWMCPSLYRRSLFCCCALTTYCDIARGFSHRYVCSS